MNPAPPWSCFVIVLEVLPIFVPLVIDFDNGLLGVAICASLIGIRTAPVNKIGFPAVLTLFSDKALNGIRRGGGDESFFDIVKLSSALSVPFFSFSS